MTSPFLFWANVYKETKAAIGKLTKPKPVMTEEVKLADDEDW